MIIAREKRKNQNQTNINLKNPDQNICGKQQVHSSVQQAQQQVSAATSSPSHKCPESKSTSSDQQQISRLSPQDVRGGNTL